MENDGYNIDSSDSPSVPHKLVQGTENQVDKDSQTQIQVEVTEGSIGEESQLKAPHLVIESHVGLESQSQIPNTDEVGSLSVDDKEVPVPQPEARKQASNDTQSAVTNGDPCEKSLVATGTPDDPMPVINGRKPFEQNPVPNGKLGEHSV